MKKSITVLLSIIFISASVSGAYAEGIPEWVKNNALWYGQGLISETEFLDAIKFLIENDILIVEIGEPQPTIKHASVLIPNGNSEISKAGFYSPLNLQIPSGTTVSWVNEDSVLHNIQSLDEKGKVVDWFNSPPLNTGDVFEFTFEDPGVYHYYCSFHPWRVGTVTVE
ncbi:cupredoxin domain-containing protein [Nitrosopumilus sp. S4]